ncbi:hypothetical protein [Novosphingobium album (ex Liu et al. 2023)]|uniref:Uncharacterized protein n=1 Tax=Novosphingobium album (ex Liu et al. 2023) TaxID=3031130 RepID=A0ABT5WPR5_9SPHN|nr:hypothetical protein [Novosphingobium album (ex Liu et al. 2023)]MDE8652008.1 hypothetical protein [Novosphingobium album (ex Liu et al. 2023)]
MTAILPPGFEDLLPFIDWARPTELERNSRRWSASLEESQAFYDTMLGRGPDALEYLGQFALADIAGADRTLLDMCLALAECSATIEMYGEPRPKYVFPIARFVPTHDAWALAGTGARA